MMTNAFWRALRGCSLAAVVVLGGCAGAPEGDEGTDPSLQPGESNVQPAEWVGGHNFHICNGTVNLREYASDGAPSRGVLENGNFGHSYSNYDTEDGTVGWDPVYVDGGLKTHGWLKRSHMCFVN